MPSAKAFIIGFLPAIGFHQGRAKVVFEVMLLGPALQKAKWAFAIFRKSFGYGDGVNFILHQDLTVEYTFNIPSTQISGVKSTIYQH